MAQADIVRVWRDALYAYLAVRVAADIDGKDGEYIGRVLLSDLQNLSAVQQKAALMAAVKAERDRSKALAHGGTQDIAGITGTVSI